MRTNTKVSSTFVDIVRILLQPPAAKGPAMETELSRVVDALPGFVWTAFPDGQIDFLNRRWCEYTGLSVDEAYRPK